MGKLVADLLLLSRLDAGVVKLEPQSLDLQSLLTDLIRQFTPLASKQEVDITMGASQGTVVADPTRLRQVLLILLDNALGYTPPGGEIRLSSETTGNSVQINVHDTGTGISQEHLRHIFERFYHVGQNGRVGSGLGLTIAKSLAEAMGADLQLESAGGQGTTARLTLPINR